VLQPDVDLDETLPAALGAAPQTTRDGMAIARKAMAGWALSAAAANVIMQLSHLPIGHGVANSTVESGRADKHPVKRLRTTATYLAIALYGTDEERAYMRRETNRSHRQVRSSATDQVAYNAFDTDLQLWVAACLYWGVADMYERSFGTPDDATADALYAHSARLGTTLQVPASAWPADRQAFAEYFTRGIEQIEFDDVTAKYLRNLARFRLMPWPISKIIGPFHQYVTTGYLPAPFREQLGLPWSPGKQRVHDALIGFIAKASRVLPGPVRRFPFNAYLHDARRRIKRGRPIV